MHHTFLVKLRGRTKSNSCTAVVAACWKSSRVTAVVAVAGIKLLQQNATETGHLLSYKEALGLHAANGGLTAQTVI